MLEARVSAELRVKVPFLFTGRCIQGKHALVGGTEVEHIANLDRGDFVGDFTRIVWLLQVAGAEYPGFLQVVYVVGINLL